VCDLTYSGYTWIKKLTDQKWLMWLVLLMGLFLGSFPPIGERYEGTIYQIFPPKVLLFYIIGAAMVLFSLLHLQAPRKLLSNQVFMWFNKSSYGFYLVHFPVLCTVGCGLFLVLNGRLNYYIATFIVYIVSFAVTTFLAWLIAKFVERPGMKLANKVAAELGKSC
jgi:peptidoglycan/LPS O-acetylase OafA/YrhL